MTKVTYPFTKNVASPIVDAETTGEILSVLSLADNGDLAATPEQMAELGKRLAEKVDGNKYVQGEIDAKLKEFGDLKKKVDGAIKALKNQKERQKSYLAFHMLAQKLESIPGLLWKVRLTSDRKTKPKREPGPLDVVTYPDFVRVKYEWDLTALAKALESGDPLAAEVAAVEETHSVKFDSWKGNILESAKPKRASKAGKDTGRASDPDAKQGPDRQGAAEAPQP